MSLSDSLVLSRPLYLARDKCGYCHNEKPVEEATPIRSWISDNKTFKKSKTIGFQVERMSITQYEKLVNVNYRRSGTFLYKCDNLRNCCFYHTIRTNFDYFKISKELKNDLNKFNDWIGVGKNQAKHFDFGKEINKVFQSSDFKMRFEDVNDNFTEKFELFESYQNSIHNDTVTKSSFKHFLIDTPFPEKAIIEQSNNPDTDVQEFKVKRFGATQLCYYFKDKLVGVSFLDVLPTGLSSIYFIYDHVLTSEAKLSMGKISIMLELLMMKKLGLQFLYLGYYIRDCVKMKYKAKFGGQLLHPLSFEWVPFTDQIQSDIDKEFEQKFGKDSFRVSDELMQLIEDYELEFDIPENLFDIDELPKYDLPLFLINTSSIERILEKQDEIRIKVLLHGNVLELKFEELTATFKTIAVNMIRMVGIDLIDEVVMVV